MTDLDAEIEGALRRVGRDRGLDLGTIEAGQKLVDDLGFMSLDLARIIAILHGRLGSDPFSRLVPITSVRTVGDLRAAYAACLAGGASDTSLAQAAESGRSRARDRLAIRRQAQTGAPSAGDDA